MKPDEKTALSVPLPMSTAELAMQVVVRMLLRLKKSQSVFGTRLPLAALCATVRCLLTLRLSLCHCLCAGLVNSLKQLVNQKPTDDLAWAPT